MVAIGVPELILSCFEMDESCLEEDGLRYAVMTLIIMFEKSPRDVRKMVLDNMLIFKAASERFPCEADAI